MKIRITHRLGQGSCDIFDGEDRKVMEFDSIFKGARDAEIKAIEFLQKAYPPAPHTVHADYRPSYSLIGISPLQSSHD